MTIGLPAIIVAIIEHHLGEFLQFSKALFLRDANTR
jgi:hypothetical protein